MLGTPAISLWQAVVERKKEKRERNYKLFRQNLQPSWNDVMVQFAREYRRRAFSPLDVLSPSVGAFVTVTELINYQSI